MQSERNVFLGTTLWRGTPSIILEPALGNESVIIKLNPSCPLSRPHAHCHGYTLILEGMPPALRGATSLQLLVRGGSITKLGKPPKKEAWEKKEKAKEAGGLQEVGKVAGSSGGAGHDCLPEPPRGFVRCPLCFSLFDQIAVQVHAGKDAVQDA